MMMDPSPHSQHMNVPTTLCMLEVDVGIIPCGSGASTNAPCRHLLASCPVTPRNIANFLNFGITSMVI